MLSFYAKPKKKTIAHAKGQAVQLNYLIEQGGAVYDSKTKTFAVNFEKIKDVVRNLTGIIMTIQAEGDKERAQKLLDTYGYNTNITTEALNRIQDIPTDIAPIYK